MNMLSRPSAIPQWAHVPSKLVFEGADRRDPVLSICIPTFRRGALLVEAVRSALEQDWSGPFEILVVDNDPESQVIEDLLARIPELRTANFRYYVNAENTGMFGNWNRSIELGRGEWHTMLHDDDLLRPQFVSRMMGYLLANPRIDGVICRKETLGLTSRASGPAREFARRVWLDMRFLGRGTRYYRASRFFWASGNPVGLVARKADLLALGGYQPDEYPSSDHYFQMRYAARYRLHEARDMLAQIRILENESMNRDVVRRMVVGFHFLRLNMAKDGVVPSWWTRFSPAIIEYHRTGLNRNVQLGLTKAELEAEAGIPLPKARPRSLTILRGVLRGY